MNRKNFIYRTLVIATLAVMFLTIGCTTSNPVGPQNGGGIGGGNVGGGNGNGGTYVVSFWTALQELEGVEIVIDNQSFTGLRALNNAPACGDHVQGVIVASFAMGQHQLYYRLNGYTTEPVSFTIDQEGCEVLEVN